MQFAFRQRCERIDFEEDVLGPEIEAMKSGKAVAELPPGALFEFEFIDATPNQVPANEPDDKPRDPSE